MQTSDQIDQLADALAKAQVELKNPSATEHADVQPRGGGASFGYDYAPLEAVLDVTREVLGKYGLAVTQESVTFEHGAGVITRIMHGSGQWIEQGPLVLPAAGTAQAFGGALTYARRYAISSALAIASSKDDDAATSSGPARRGSARQAPVRKDPGPAPARPQPVESDDADARATRANWDRAVGFAGSRSKRSMR